jgi:5'-deoxynucleotidase YfbR-like HD superfamily hydrolase
MQTFENQIDFFKEFVFNNQVDKLDNISRFSGEKTTKTESVSQHSFWVTFFSSLLLDEMGFTDYKLRYLTLDYATFHDFDETITGDLLHPFKHNTENGMAIRKTVEHFVKYSVEKMKDNVLKSKLIKFDALKRDDDFIVAKHLVKICDWLSCIKFCYDEVMMGNKRAFAGLLYYSFDRLLDYIILTYPVFIEYEKEQAKKELESGVIDKIDLQKLKNLKNQLEYLLTVRF